MTKLVAITRVKFGSRVAATDHRGAVVAVEETHSIMPGEIFELDDVDLVKRFLNDGAAMTRSSAIEKGRAIGERGQAVPAEYAAVLAGDPLTAEEKYQDARLDYEVARAKPIAASAETTVVDHQPHGDA